MNHSTTPVPTPRMIVVIRVAYVVSALLWGLMPILGRPSRVGEFPMYTVMMAGLFLAVMTAPASKARDGQPAVVPVARAIPALLMLLLSIGNFIRLMI